MRDADGSLIDDDKAVWIQGRATWLLSTLGFVIVPNECKQK
jgi:N-acylglucosamine 2-epimerase